MEMASCGQPARTVRKSAARALTRGRIMEQCLRLEGRDVSPCTLNTSRHWLERPESCLHCVVSWMLAMFLWATAGFPK
eukprot:3627643-Pleurochrysis_carterae.AAC.1